MSLVTSTCFAAFVRYIPRCFIVFLCIVSGVFLNSLSSEWLPLAYKRAFVFIWFLSPGTLDLSGLVFHHPPPFFSVNPYLVIPAFAFQLWGCPILCSTMKVTLLLLLFEAAQTPPPFFF